MIPGPWVGLVLALAAYRLTRLVGWDTFPLAERLRDWATGAYFYEMPFETVSALRLLDPNYEPQPGEWRHERPVLAHFLGCPYCVGFWISAAVYVGWLELPVAVLYVLAPFAISGFVGLVSKNLDA